MQTAFPDLGFEIRTSITEGDVVLDRPLAALAAASPGIFTKELEVGLLTGAYDLAVHSLKDMPTSLPEGLALAAITEVRAFLGSLAPCSLVRSFSRSCILIV